MNRVLIYKLLSANGTQGLTIVGDGAGHQGFGTDTAGHVAVQGFSAVVLESERRPLVANQPLVAPLVQ